MEQMIPQILSYIPESFYILIFVLYVIGFILKQSRIEDEYIIFIILFASLVFSVFLGGFNVNSIMYGILLTACPVFINNVVKQLGKSIEKAKHEEE